MAISAELIDVYTGNPDGIYYFSAIDLRHAALSVDLHYTNASFEVTGLLDNDIGDSAIYAPLPFDHTFPAKNTDGNQSLDLSFSNVTAELIRYIELMTDAPQDSMELTFRVFLSSQTNGFGHYINQLIPPWRYEVSSVSATADAVTMSATKLNTHNRVFPRVRYTAVGFPGLVR
jgi:hypothetical protein